MTWRESRLAAQLLAEETVGRGVRAAQHQEDAAMQRSIRAMQKHQR
jgi:hypothetical protein